MSNNWWLDRIRSTHVVLTINSRSVQVYRHHRSFYTLAWPPCGVNRPPIGRLYFLAKQAANSKRRSIRRAADGGCFWYLARLPGISGEQSVTGLFLECTVYLIITSPQISCHFNADTANRRRTLVISVDLSCCMF